MSIPASGMLTESYGSVIRITEKDVLDSLNPNWTQYEPDPLPDSMEYYTAYALDPDDPLAFWLFPLPQPCHNVIVTYAGMPVVVDDAADLLTLNDAYVSTMADYVVYRALMKESRAGSAEIATSYHNTFLSKLGAHRQIIRGLPEHKNRAPDAEG